jgi:hypothetical protein
MKNPLSNTLLSLALAATVVLNGAHAKDVFNLAGFSDGFSAGAKIAADLHPHTDKAMAKMIQDIPQLDGRSLRLRDFKRLQFGAWKNWLGNWREQLALLLS